MNLIEYNTRNLFLGKSFAKDGEKNILRAFLKNQKLSIIFGSVVKRFIQFVFIGCQIEDYIESGLKEIY